MERHHDALHHRGLRRLADPARSGHRARQLQERRRAPDLVHPRRAHHGGPEHARVHGAVPDPSRGPRGGRRGRRRGRGLRRGPRGGPARWRSVVELLPQGLPVRRCVPRGDPSVRLDGGGDPGRVRPRHRRPLRERELGAARGPGRRDPQPAGLPRLGRLRRAGHQHDPPWPADLHRPQRRARPLRSPRGAHQRRERRVLRGAALRGPGRAGDARDLRGRQRRRARRHGDLPRGRRARGEPRLLDVRPGARRLVLVPLRPVSRGELGGHDGERERLDLLDPVGAGAHDHRSDHHPHGHRRWAHAPDQRALHPGAAGRHRSLLRRGVLLRPGSRRAAARADAAAGSEQPALRADRRGARRHRRPRGRPARLTSRGTPGAAGWTAVQIGPSLAPGSRRACRPRGARRPPDRARAPAQPLSASASPSVPCEGAAGAGVDDSSPSAGSSSVGGSSSASGSASTSSGLQPPPMDR